VELSHTKLSACLVSLVSENSIDFSNGAVQCRIFRICSLSCCNHVFQWFLVSLGALLINFCVIVIVSELRSCYGSSLHAETQDSDSMQLTKQFDNKTISIGDFLCSTETTSLANVSLNPSEIDYQLCFQQLPQQGTFQLGLVELNYNSECKQPEAFIQHRRCYSSQEYKFIINAWQKGVGIAKIAEILSMINYFLFIFRYAFKNYLQHYMEV